MAANFVIQVHKIDDQVLVTTLQSIKELFPEEKVNCNVSLVQGLNTRLQDVGDETELIGRYAFQLGVLSTNLGGDQSVSVSFSRTPSSGPSAKYDEFTVSYGRDVSSWEDDKDIVAAVHAILGALDVPGGAESTGEDNDTLRQQILGFGAAHKQMLASLNKSVVDAEQRRIEAQAEFEEAEKKRSEKLAEALAEIEREREQLKLESYRSERRNMLQSLSSGATNDLRKTLTAPAAARASWGVFAASLVLAVFAGLLAFTSISQLDMNSVDAKGMIAFLNEISPEKAQENDWNLVLDSSMFATNWYLIARSSLASLVAIGALIYAANWLRGYYNAIQQANRDIEQFNADLVRAGWVIETILEVKHEHDADVPEAWIQGVTNGLFERPNAQEQASGPTEALRMLMGYGVSLSVGPDGTKMDVSEKSAKKISNDAKKVT
ncbi:hypothetical protein RA28_19620 [Ruegeria sp. ANG-S4]|uniref:hypothetical protein n=1 Tax=Ruegeria sp. ANG-S4 TaxID=1577904 RepID=UPI00057DE285|nr:hypothetical protein [Ruegeria sp. ANG-S4]KIC43836.1 hypothetical protein RA28_19620 [Ruegeria sp. ANG-S4]